MKPIPKKTRTHATLRLEFSFTRNRRSLTNENYKNIYIYNNPLGTQL